MPLVTLPMATPMSRAARRLLTEKVMSQPLRHHCMGCLLRNSMETARKMRVSSRSMKAR